MSQVHPVNNDPLQGCDQVEPLLSKLQATFKSGKTKSIQWRKQQLNACLRGLDDMKDEITDAWLQDHNRDAFMAELVEYFFLKSSILKCLKNIDEWTKDFDVDAELSLAPSVTQIRYEPLGVVCVYGTWNIPFQLTFKPMIEAICAGNCVLIKPSEMVPRCAQVMRRFVDTYLDTEAIVCINGGVELSRKLNTQRFDLIFFTGSTQVGRIVQMEAAKNLVPTILELGGKCPGVVDQDCDMPTTINKIAGSKTSNCGQVCIAVDYALVHESRLEEFMTAYKEHVLSVFGDTRDSKFTGKMINAAAVDRLENMIQTSGGQLIFGGQVDSENRFVEPTLILNPDLNSQLMQEEIFGPILPVITFKNFDEAVDLIQSKEKPLAVYYYGNEKSPNMQMLKEKTSSGAFTANEVIVHVASSFFGFGGVGQSGQGRYGGYEGFKSFSNRKSVFIKAAKQPKAALEGLKPPFENRDTLRKLIPYISAITKYQFKSFFKWFFFIIFMVCLYFLTMKYVSINIDIDISWKSSAIEAESTSG